MNYKVLYRKYRPSSFEEIIGQEYTIKTLKNSVKSRNISHAYIFSGPRGTGKTSAAKVFSKAINCLNPIQGEPCGKCEFCLNYSENPDIIEIDAASNNGVDEIRSLIDNVKLTPTNGRYKVYIIDEVHMLTTSAFNALLLTLEEPPSHVVFILATTNIENVPITILSRCQRFDFRKIEVDDIVNRLKEICKLEGIEASEDALTEIAYLSDGGLRDSLSILDQLSKNDKKISIEEVESQIKTVSKKSIDDLLNMVEANDIDSFIERMQEYKNLSIDYKVIIKKILDNTSGRLKNIKKGKKTQRLCFEDYKKMVLELTDCLSKININVDPYLIIETILLGYFDDLEGKEKKPEEEKTYIEKEKVENSDNNKNTFIDIRINNCFVNAKKEYLNNAKESTKKIIENSKTKGKIRSIIEDSEVVAASREYLIFTVNNDHEAGKANKLVNEIEKEYKKVLNDEYKIVFISEEKWKEEKKNYINNIKLGKIYKFIDEDSKICKKEELKVNEVFNLDKVEIE